MSKIKDVIIALFIGEISAWLLLILARGLLSAGMYESAKPGLNLLPIIFPILCAIFIFLVDIFGKRISIIRQAGKFILVGGFNTLIDWGILSLAIFVFRGWSINPENKLFDFFFFSIAFYSLFKAISFVVAATNGFFWNKFWTFKQGSTEKIGREFLQFFIVTFLGFLINVGIASGIFKLVKPLGGATGDQWAIAAAVVATAISMFWNFLGYKFIVFDNKKNLPAVRPAERPEPHFPPRKIV